MTASQGRERLHNATALAGAVATAMIAERCARAREGRGLSGCVREDDGFIAKLCLAQLGLCAGRHY